MYMYIYINIKIGSLNSAYICNMALGNVIWC